MSHGVIRVENLTKQYRYGTINHGMLFRDLQSWWARVQGKEDPNAKINSLGIKGQRGYFKALDDISFEVQQGEVLGIIGRNGAGKTTLLKIISRVTAPTRGEVKIKGRIASLLEVGTGFHPELTGRENIYLNGAILGLTRRDIQQKFDSIVDFAEIEPFVDTPVKRYSSGMYVRLAFAVAANLEPEILVVDEVLAVGDAQFQRKSIGKMEQVAKEGRTLLFVSHNMASVKNLCSRSLYLSRGKLISDGDTSTAISKYLDESSDSNETIKFFSDNQDSPIFIKRLAIMDEYGQPCSVFTLSQQVILEIEYVVRKKLNQSMVIFAVSKDGTYVFQSHDIDLRPDLFKERNPGAYCARIRISRKFLTPGVYYVSVSAAAGATGQYGHDGHPFALKFTIEEEGEDIFYKSYAKHRGMLVIAELEWDTVRQSM